MKASNFLKMKALMNTAGVSVDLEGVATEEFVRNKIAEAQMSGGEVDLSGYAQKSEIPTKVSQLENDKKYLTQHQDISGKLDADRLPEAVEDALAQAKASGEFDGKDGSNGVSTTHSWSGTTLTITSASGTSSANLKGDKGDKGDTGATGGAGKDGSSVTVKSVSESTADGGSNVVTFSDGKTLTVKNGSKGSTGTAGKTPVKGTDYWTTADREQMVSDVLAVLPKWTGGSY